jgi:hypothetical protein
LSNPALKRDKSITPGPLGIIDSPTSRTIINPVFSPGLPIKELLSTSPSKDNKFFSSKSSVDSVHVSGRLPPERAAGIIPSLSVPDSPGSFFPNAPQESQSTEPTNATSSEYEPKRSDNSKSNTRSTVSESAYKLSSIVPSDTGITLSTSNMSNNTPVSPIRKKSADMGDYKIIAGHHKHHHSHAKETPSPIINANNDNNQNGHSNHQANINSNHNSFLLNNNNTVNHKTSIETPVSSTSNSKPSSRRPTITTSAPPLNNPIEVNEMGGKGASANNSAYNTGPRNSSADRRKKLEEEVKKKKIFVKKKMIKKKDLDEMRKIAEIEDIIRLTQPSAEILCKKKKKKIAKIIFFFLIVESSVEKEIRRSRRKSKSKDILSQEAAALLAEEISKIDKENDLKMNINNMNNNNNSNNNINNLRNSHNNNNNYNNIHNNKEIDLGKKKSEEISVKNVDHKEKENVKVLENSSENSTPKENSKGIKKKTSTFGTKLAQDHVTIGEYVN